MCNSVDSLIPEVLSPASSGNEAGWAPRATPDAAAKRIAVVQYWESNSGRLPTTTHESFTSNRSAQQLTVLVSVNEHECEQCRYESQI